MEYNIIGGLLRTFFIILTTPKRIKKKMKKISIKLDVVAARELQRAIAQELECADEDLEKLLNDEEESQDNTSTTE